MTPLHDPTNGADRIHAPSPTSAGVDFGPYRQHTLCGVALRGASDDMTTATIEDFERIADRDQRCCWECKTLL